MSMWKVAVLVVTILWSIQSALAKAKEFIKHNSCNLANWLRKDARGKVALLVIAHPDDECMFFTPTIRSFISAGWTIKLLCITTGNADGLGKVRTEELMASCSVLGIKDVQILDDEKMFPDSMKVKWNIESVADSIFNYLDENADVDAVVTFDSYGVSGHSNHRDVCQGVRLALGQLDEPITLLELESVPLAVKYIGIWGYLYEAINVSVEMTLAQEDTGREKTLVASLTWTDVLAFTLGAMRKHRSQLVWFRWLYLIFSRYCHVNTLRLKSAR